MTGTQSSRVPGSLWEVGLATFHQKFDRVREALGRRKVYRGSRAELASLGDRELSDLGITRSEIRRLAWEAAYGR